MELSEKQLNNVLCSKSRNKNVGLEIIANIEGISEADIFIITVPTPIDENKKPDLAPLASATMDVSRYVNVESVILSTSTDY